MNKKGEFSTVLGFLVIVLMIVTTLYFVQLWMGYGANEVQEVYSNYFITSLDRDIATYSSVFEKTALFSGLASTVNHLSAHGGVPVDIEPEKTNIEPVLNFYNDIYSWTFIKDCNLETRIPFTTYRDKNILLGNYEVPLDNPNNVELKTAIINVWMFKKGSIDVSCNPGSCTITGDTTIEETGTHVYSITGATHLVLSADEGTALLKLVGASPYEGSADKEIFINSLNEYFTKILQNMQETADFSNRLTITPINAIFGRNDLFPTGFSRFNEGIIGKIDDPTLPNVVVWNFGNVDETLKVRYWNLYDYAEQFTLTAPDVLTYRLWNVLNTLKDYQGRQGSRGCGGPPTLGNGCPTDKINYNTNQIHNYIQKDVDLYEKTITIADPDITLNLEVPPSLFDGCYINSNGNAVEECNEGNFEYYEYLEGHMWNIRSCKSEKCGRCYNRNGCESNWYHRYILKKVRIQATLTDTKYKIIDVNGNWNPQTFTFIIELPIIDDNCCNGVSLCENKGTSDCDTSENKNGNPFPQPKDHSSLTANNESTVVVEVYTPPDEIVDDYTLFAESKDCTFINTPGTTMTPSSFTEDAYDCARFDADSEDQSVSIKCITGNLYIQTCNTFDKFCKSDSGQCVECIKDGHCAIGVCNTAINECVECTEDTDCAIGFTCDLITETCI